MKAGPQLKRRGFIGGALIGLGGVAGYLARKSSAPSEKRKSASTALDSRFAYDVSEFEKTDPKLLRYRPLHAFDTGFARVRSLATSRENRVWVAGDRAVKRFDLAGPLELEIALAHPAHAVQSGGNGDLLVALRNSFQIFDGSGKSIYTGPNLGEKTFLTAIARRGESFFLADAGNREIIVFDRSSERVLDRFGRQDAARNNPGFAVPSPYFDLAIAPDDRLRVVNPGRLRIETYTLDGRFQSSWGEPGLRIDRFCGCCNPVFFALTPSGGFITSEKGLARINLYSAEGTFQGAVAGPETLVQEKELAKMVNAESTGGAGFDIAVDANGHVLALDPYLKTVRVFSPVGES